MTSRSFLKTLIVGALSLGFTTFLSTNAEAANPCKILPLGDSITYGTNVDVYEVSQQYVGGYRAHLVWSFATSPSPTVGPILMVGVRTDNATPLMISWGQAAHSGYPGATNLDLTNAVNLGAAFDSTSPYAPDVILLHAGTNDILSPYTPAPRWATAQSRLVGLLDALRTKNPNATVLLAKILPLTGAYAWLNAEVAAYNSTLDALAQSRRNIGHDVRVVDQYTNFPTTTLLDGIHPNWAGYAEMAARWRAALDPIGC